LEIKLIEASPSNKKVILGTALWGWGITRTEAFSLLEQFFESSGVVIDTATNYPINKCKDDFGLSVRWLTEWTRLHPNHKYSLIVKLGAKNNMGGSESDLRPENIIETTKKLKDAFGHSLSCISIHWDNRGDEPHDQIAISRTVDAMLNLREAGLDIGLSGIKYPKNYCLSNPLLTDDWIIQVKENFLTNKSRLLYQECFPNAKYFAYGINMGGLKLESCGTESSIKLRGIKVDSSLVEKIRIVLESAKCIDPCPININQLSLAFAHCNDFLSGVIIGPRNIKQLEETLRFWEDLHSSNNKLIWSFLFNKYMKIN
jgi:aryl-alcohol dehydrogenase-like predicted oxidoreductase